MNSNDPNSPMIYRKIQNDKRMRVRLVVKGYKSFSKLYAAGEDTKVVLDNLSKSRNMKFIRRFEFDPYLCEKSHVRPFAKALKKLKDVKDLNLVIRRLDYADESSILAPYMIRLIRLKKFRIEVTKFVEYLSDKPDLFFLG